MADAMSDRPQPIPQSSTMNSGRDSSVTGLIKSLADDVTRLFSQEVALAKAEVSTALDHIKAGVLSLAIGLGVLFVGFIVLLFAAAEALSLVVASWLAYLIVGGVVAIIGLILLMKAKKNLNPESMVPNRTIDSLKKDEAMVRRTVS
ncbi:MAG TPA: phage holin family protein [Lautropia sp.]|nr:phage holin family protein [Lautropia sp.]